MTDIVDNSSTVVNNTTIVKPATIQPPAHVGRILATMSAFWDWFDQRDVEKHLVAIFTLYLTWKELTWGMHYSESNAARSGVEIAAILAAIGVPLSALQTAVISFYFKARVAGAQTADT